MRRDRLIDLEELEKNILEPLDREYFHEAVECYSIGSYRAAAILCWNLACLNMKRKLQRLASEDGEAKKYWIKIENKEKSNTVFEEDLLSAFHALEIFSTSEETAIRHTRTLRHYSAHPGEYKITAEEVRSCFRVIVDFVLSRPYYRGYSFINEIEGYLKDPIFLPFSGFEEVLKATYSQVRPDLIPRIAEKIVHVMTTSSPDKTIRENSQKMLTCMIGHPVSDSIMQKVVIEISKLKEVSLETLSHSFSMNPTSIKYLDFPIRQRIIRHLIEEKADIFGIFQFNRHKELAEFIRTEIELNDRKEWIIKLVKDNIRKIPEIVSIIPEHFCQFAFEKIVEDLEYSGWNNFETNNSAITFMQSFGLKTFSHLNLTSKTRLLSVAFSASLKGSKLPTEFLLGFSDWEKPWLDVFNSEIEKRIINGEVVPTIAFNFVKKSLEQQAVWKEAWDNLFQPRNEGDFKPNWFRAFYDIDNILIELTELKNIFIKYEITCTKLDNLILNLRKPRLQSMVE